MIIATITKIEGNIFIKQLDGTIQKLSVGDTIESGEVVFGADEASAYSVEYAGNGEVMTFSGVALQLYDPTMIPTGSDGAEGAVESASANPFAQSILSSEELAALLGEEGERGNVLEETSSGKEAPVESELQGDTFAQRTGAITDVNSGLRNAKFFGVSHDFEQKGIFGREDPGQIDPPAGGGGEIIPPVGRPPEPPVTIPLPPQPPVNPPPLRGSLTLSGDTEVPEGQTASYTLTLSEPPKTTLSIILQITHATTEEGDLEARFISVSIPAGQTNTTFAISNGIDAIYEGNEEYVVSIVSASGGEYNELIISDETVTTTIADAQPKPTLTIDDQSINEQEGTMTFTVSLSGLTERDVTFEYTSANTTATAGADYTAVSGTKTIPAGSTSITITVPIHDDYLADNGETFRILLSNPSESAVIGDGVGVGSILDDTTADPYNNPGSTESDTPDTITIRLFALDGDGNRVSANDVAEGSNPSYIAVAFDKNGNELDISGTVQVSFGGGTATGGGTDYVSTTQTVTLGETFTTATTDDYLSDNNETFTLAIVDETFSDALSYESIDIDTTAVSTTIKDNTNPLAPGGETGGYGPEDTVYVQLITNDTVSEGGTLSHTVKLVDSHGTAISVAAGETITVNITYANGTGLNSDEYTASTPITILGGTSFTTFDNPTHIDTSIESTESYTATIGTVTQANGTYEKVAPYTTSNGADGDVISVSGTIIDGVDAVDDAATVVEGSHTIDHTTSGNLLDNDERGAAGTISAFTYKDETGTTQTGTIGTEVDTQYGRLTLNADGTWTYISDPTEAHGTIIDTITYTLTDGSHSSQADFDITVTDTTPTAVADTNAITEEVVSVSGNVFGASGATSGDYADTIGADTTATPVSGVARGSSSETTDLTNANTVGAGHSVNGDYGSVIINADGTYTYTLDNTNLSIQGLTTNEHLTDTFSYTIKDSDGDISTATLTITIDGADDGVIVTAPETYTGTSAINTDHVVYESGLLSGSSPSAANIGVVSTFTIQALDGFDHVVIAGTSLSAAQIQALDTTHTQTVSTTYGSMVLNSYSMASDGIITIGYTYTLSSAPHISGTDTMDNILITAYDTDGVPDSGADTLSIKIIDDSPAALDDIRNINEGTNTITGNVVTGTTNGDQADHGYADGLMTNPVVKVMYGSTEMTVGARTETTDGYVTVNADGSYTFEAKSGLDHLAGADLVENFIYTIRDNDGDETTGALRVNVKDLDASIAGSTASIDEDDLANGSDTSKESTSILGTLTVTPATDAFDVQFDATGYPSGLTSGGVALVYAITNGGHTLTATAGASGAAIFTCVLSDVATTTPDYTFTLSGPLDHANATDQNILAVTPKVKVVELDGTVATTTFTVNVTDDVPIANVEDALSVTEGSVALSGMINLMDNDVTGADAPITLTGFTYTDESGNVVSGTFGNGMDTRYGTLTVNSDGTWNYTSDATESNASPLLDTFNYTIRDYDGDTSSAAQNIYVTDGADPTITPTNLVVSETTFGTGAGLTPFTVTGTALNVVQGSDSIANTKFTDATITSLTAMGIKSGGADLFYTLSDDKHTITATQTNASGAEVFVVTITTPASINAQYDFKLTLPLDHTKNLDHDTSWVLPFNVYTVDSDDNGIVDNNDDASGSFTVTVEDSTPSAVDVTKTINEDEVTASSRIIRISQDALPTVAIDNNDDGSFTSVIMGDYIDVYDADHTDVIGKLYNLGDGTLRFDPNANYSDDGSNSLVRYQVTDADGDTEEADITLSVTPVADTPNVSGDSVTTSEDVSQTIALHAPTSSDTTDQNSIFTATLGDYSERLGLIELTNMANGVGINTSADASLWASTGTSSKLYILLSDGIHTQDAINLYNTNSANANYKTMTIADFEALKVVPALNAHNDIDIKMNVTAYEVNDLNYKISDVNGKAATTQTYHVEVSALTDPITLSFDNTMTLGDITTAINTNDTFTYTATANEGIAAINLQSLMSSTSGNSVDLDGSEQRSYTVSGIPEGTIINLGGTTATANASGIATVDFSNASELLSDPTFTMTFPEQYSGTVNATIILSVYDQDADTTSINAGLLTSPLTQTLYFNIVVAPVADTVTVAIKQSFGLEDAGRLTDGTTTVASGINGIDLDVTITSVDTSETYTLNLSDIPDGAEIYYNGSLVSVAGIIDGSSNANITATNTTGATWSIEIKEFSNSAPFKYIPVLNSNADVTLKATANSVDGADGESSTILDVNVIVTGVADTPTHNATNSITITDTASASYTYQAIVTEDTPSIALNTLFTADTPNFSSFDIAGSDGSETLFVTITGVPDGFGISGATFLGGSGTTREWQVPVANFNSANLTVPANYSGEVAFKIQLQTIENDGNKSTLLDVPLKVLITPEAEGTVNNTASQNEDVVTTLSFAFNNGGDTNEALTLLEIDTYSLSLAGVILYKNGTDITSTGWVSVNTATDVITASAPADLDTDYTFALRYSVSDTTTDGSLYTDVTQGGGYNATTPNVINATYTVTVNPVTDTTTFTLDTFTDTDGDGTTDISYVSGTQTVTVTDNTIFQVPLRLTADDMVSESSNGQDLDSETIQTRVTISGVPQGVIVVGGTYLGDTDGGNTGLWRVDITDDLIINNTTGEMNSIAFEVGESTYPNINQDITLSISHNDGSGDVLTNVQTFTLVLDGASFGTSGIGTGGGTNTDPLDLTLAATSDINFIEDAPKALGDLVTLGDSTTLLDTGKYAITITNVVGGSVSGMELVNGFYTYQGTGTVADITAYLNSGAISITPIANTNINTPANVTFDVTITTYGSNSHNTYSIPVVSPIAPVSDATSISISGDGAHANEDTNSANFETITIDLNNLSDNTRVIITGNTVSIKLTETVIDGAIGGVVKDSLGNPLTVDGTTWNTFTVSDMATNIVLKYYPQADHYGSLAVTVKVETQEDPLTSGYTTSPIITETTQTITIAPVNNGLNATPTMVGNEDEIVLINFGGATLSDSSEHITSAKLSGVPFGYAITLEGVVQAGTVIGKNANGDYLYEYNFNVNSITDLEKIGIQRIGITDFSGEVSGVTLSVTSGEAGLETAETWPITVKFNPQADALLSMTVTKTFGSEYTWVPININATVRDVDGSETLRVILVGAVTVLDATAQFRLADGTLIPSTGAMNATFSAGTWTIEGITYDQINNVQMQYHEYSGNVNVTVKTVDTASGLATSILSDADDSQGTFDLQLASSTNITTGDEDNIIQTSNAGVTVNAGGGNDIITGGSGSDIITGGTGSDTIYAGGGNDTIVFDAADAVIDGGSGIDTLTLSSSIDFSALSTVISNVEKIDITPVGNQTISGLSLDDIFNMTDSSSSHTLTIEGNTGGDTVSSITTTGWTSSAGHGAVVSGYEVYTYTKGADTVTLKVDVDLNNTTNLA